MQATTTSELVDAIAQAGVAGTEAGLRAGGALPRPQVHLLVEDLAQPYLGYVSCRPFYRGNDVVQAFASMGLVGTMLQATRLVVVWEHQDLCIALGLDGAAQEPTGQVVLDAHRDGGHVLHWFPFTMQDGPPASGGWPTVIPNWGTVSAHPDVELPNPVGALLATWRQPRIWADADLLGAMAEFDEFGYQQRWVRRASGERGQSAAVRLLLREAG